MSDQAQGSDKLSETQSECLGEKKRKERLHIEVTSRSM